MVMADPFARWERYRRATPPLHETAGHAMQRQQSHRRPPRLTGAPGRGEHPCRGHWRIVLPQRRSSLQQRSWRQQRAPPLLHAQLDRASVVGGGRPGVAQHEQRLLLSASLRGSLETRQRHLAPLLRMSLHDLTLRVMHHCLHRFGGQGEVSLVGGGAFVVALTPSSSRPH